MSEKYNLTSRDDQRGELGGSWVGLVGFGCWVGDSWHTTRLSESQGGSRVVGYVGKNRHSTWWVVGYVGCGGLCMSSGSDGFDGLQ